MLPMVLVFVLLSSHSIDYYANEFFYSGSVFSAAAASAAAAAASSPSPRNEAYVNELVDLLSAIAVAV